MKHQYVITSLLSGEKYRLDTVDTEIRESLNSLKLPRIEECTEDEHWDEILIDIMSRGYSITIEEAPELLFDFSQDIQNPTEEILKSKNFQIIYDKNYNDYIPNDLYWSEHVIEDFIEKINSIGYNTTFAQVNFDISNCQGRGASFDGSLSIQKFMELNEENYYRELDNSIKHGYVTENVDIIKTSFANHYSHKKTREMDSIGFITISASEILEGERLISIEKGMKAERLELCNYLMRQLEEAYENEFSKERLLDIFMDNEYKFNEEGNIV